MDDGWKHIIDPEVKEIFRQGALNETLVYLYASQPGGKGTKYYHFIRRSLTEGDREEKMTKTQLVAGFTRRTEND